MELIEINSENAEEFAAYINEDIREDLERTFFSGIGALSDDGSPKGAMVYELKNSESEHDTRSRIHLFKADDKETKKALMNEYDSAVENEGVAESFYESPDEAMAKDLKSFGFSLNKSESLDIMVSIEDIKRVISILNIKKKPSNIIPLSKISILQYRSFVKNCLFKNQKGLLEDLAYLPMKWFERDVSSASVTDDKVDGVLLIRKAPSGVLCVGLYVAFGPDYKKNLTLLMANTAEKIVELYPEDTHVIIRRHSETVRKLTDKIFSNIKGDTLYSGTK